jgi:hypothetical protein
MCIGMGGFGSNDTEPLLSHLCKQPEGQYGATICESVIGGLEVISRVYTYRFRNDLFL